MKNGTRKNTNNTAKPASSDLRAKLDVARRCFRNHSAANRCSGRDAPSTALGTIAISFGRQTLTAPKRSGCALYCRATA